MKTLLLALVLVPAFAFAGFNPTHHFHYENDVPKCDTGCFISNDDCTEGTTTPPVATSTPPVEGTSTPPTDGTSTPPIEGTSTPPTDGGGTTTPDVPVPPVVSSGGGGGHHHVSTPTTTDATTTPAAFVPLNALPYTGYGWGEYAQDNWWKLLILALFSFLAAFGFVSLLPRKV